MSVEAAAPLVDVQSAGISEVVENERIVELPLQGRQRHRPDRAGGRGRQHGRRQRPAEPAGFRRHLGRRRAANRRGVRARRRDAQRSRTTTRTCRSPSRTRCRSSAWPRAGSRRRTACTRAPSVNAVTRSGTNALLTGTLSSSCAHQRFNATDQFAAVGADGKKVERRSGSQPVRRHARRADSPGQALFLRWVPGHGHAADAGRRSSASCRRRRCWRATSRRSRRRRATPAGRSPCGRPFVNNRINPALFSQPAVTIAKRLPTPTISAAKSGTASRSTTTTSRSSPGATIR